MSKVAASLQDGPEPRNRKWASRGWSDEMTPEAVRRRLEKLEQLYQAWLELKRLKLVSRVEY